MTNPWRPKFVPAHRKRRDKLRNAVLAPLRKHVCDPGCTHPPRTDHA